MDLIGPRAKLDRAHEHLKALDVETRLAFGAKPVFISDDFDQETRCHIVRLRIGEVGADSRLRLGTVIGDLVHNVRSALDQAAWLIACRSNPVEELWEPDTARQIAFPITWKRRQFRAHSVMPFIADDAKAVLEGLQPYQGGATPEALGRLNTLWNIDKHRVIHRVALHVDLSGVALRGRLLDPLKDGPIDTTWHEIGDRVEDGAKIATVKFGGGREPPSTRVEVTGEPRAIIGFGSGFFALEIGGIAGLVGHGAAALAAIEELPDAPA